LSQGARLSAGGEAKAPFLAWGDKFEKVPPRWAPKHGRQEIKALPNEKIIWH